MPVAALKERILRRSRVVPAVAVLSLAAIGAAASASSGNTEGSGTAAADEVAAVIGDESGAAFTACMRDHGLPDFPDVTITSDGRVVLDLEAAGIDPLSSTYQEALAACEGELPEGTQLPDQPAAPAAPSAPAALEDSDCAPTAPSAPPEPA